jgi:oxygen-independent coproporphyrinogen-3 oxidase
VKLLAESPETIDIADLIDKQIQGDYVYMYPPRQAYYAIQEVDLEVDIRASLAKSSGQPVNIYIHFPFCRQICGFCNLYSVRANPDEAFAQYISLIEVEIGQWSELLAGRPVDTIYLGGGTPSIFPVSELERCLGKIEESMGISRSAVAEVALEVAPDTVSSEKLRALCQIGITRVNLGLQSTSDNALHQMGRNHGYSLARERIESALSAGFRNVCVDLIYGLPQQTAREWQSTVEEVAMLGAQTVCAYPLTLRPNTGFSRRQIHLKGSEQYDKYEIAYDVLSANGYTQETHVRYIMAGRGGYRQKENHWAGQDVIGIGAGARGYLRDCDYRNGYSIERRRDALDEYKSRILAGHRPYTSGFRLDYEERMRRRIILGLLELDRMQFEADFGSDAFEAFSDVFTRLIGLELLEVSDQFIKLTRQGRKYRDLIVQLFFSSEAWKRIREFDYSE